jgi:hypothetical protein
VVGGQAHARLGLQKLAHRVALVLGLQLAADGEPDVVFVLGVGDRRRRLAGAPGQCRGGDIVASRAVDRVVGAGMVVGEMDGDLTAFIGGHRRVQLRFLVHP